MLNDFKDGYYKIIIDAAHGGQDYGETLKNFEEKDYCLYLSNLGLLIKYKPVFPPCPPPFDVKQVLNPSVK